MNFLKNPHIIWIRRSCENGVISLLGGKAGRIAVEVRGSLGDSRLDLVENLHRRKVEDLEGLSTSTRTGQEFSVSVVETIPRNQNALDVPHGLKLGLYLWTPFVQKKDVVVPASGCKAIFVIIKELDRENLQLGLLD